MPLAGNVLEPVEAHALLGLATEELPVRANAANGAVTAALLQYEGGHFVGFETLSAKLQIARFLESAASGAVPTVVAP